MSMDITDPTKTYKVPSAQVIKIKAQSVLCQSGLYEKELNPDDFE